MPCSVCTYEKFHIASTPIIEMPKRHLIDMQGVYSSAILVSLLYYGFFLNIISFYSGLCFYPVDNILFLHVTCRLATLLFHILMFFDKNAKC